MKTLRINHFRIPESERGEGFGRPDEGQLESYSRRFGFYDRDEETPHTHGGATEISVIDVFGDDVTERAICSLGDPFEYAEGRRVAALFVIRSALRRGVLLEEDDIELLLEMVSRGGPVY